MLSDRHCELLTAYVDGELDARERQVVERLLSSSPDARDFLDKLAADSKELHNLPSRKAPDTLANSVMITLNDSQQRPAPAPRPVVKPVVTPPPPSGIPGWLGLALAACVLGVVGVGTFFLAGALLYKKNDDNLPKPAVLDPFLADLFGNPAAKFGEDVKEAETGVRLVLAEMQEEPVKKRLANELKKEAGFWFDIPTAKNSRAVEQFTSAFQASGITVLVDNKAKDSLAKPMQQKVQYVLYAENLSLNEVSQILSSVSKAEQAKPAAKGLQTQMLMTAITGDKREMLANAMGVKPEKIDPAKMGPLLPVMIEVPGNPKDKRIQKDTAAERLAVLLTLTDSGAGMQSPELQKFLGSRQGLVQGTVQMVLVIHEELAG